MFAYLGFIVCFLTLGKATLLMIAWGFNSLGRYNIGGVTNPIGEKVLWSVLFIAVVCCWCWLLSTISITISL